MPIFTQHFWQNVHLASCWLIPRHFRPNDYKGRQSVYVHNNDASGGWCIVSNWALSFSFFPAENVLDIDFRGTDDVTAYKSAGWNRSCFLQLCTYGARHSNVANVLHCYLQRLEAGLRELVLTDARQKNTSWKFSCKSFALHIARKKVSGE